MAMTKIQELVLLTIGIILGSLSIVCLFIRCLKCFIKFKNISSLSGSIPHTKEEKEPKPEPEPEYQDIIESDAKFNKEAIKEEFEEEEFEAEESESEYEDENDIDNAIDKATKSEIPAQRIGTSQFEISSGGINIIHFSENIDPDDANRTLLAGKLAKPPDINNEDIDS